MPWTMKVKSSLRRMLMPSRPSSRPCRGAPSLHLFYGLAGRLPHRGRAVLELDAVLAEDLRALLLPGARNAEDGDRLGRVLAELEAGLDHAARDDVDAGVG